MTRRAIAPEKVFIPGPAGPLEALVETPSGDTSAVAVVCHPHPLHGGTMTNKVAHTLSRAFQRAGAVSVRFNFRGVGESAGTHDDGNGERDDAAAVARWALAEYPERPLWLGGFSFGAGIAAAVSARVGAAALVTVALPVARLGSGLVPPGCPWLIVHGSEDELVPLADLIAWRDLNAPEVPVAVLDGATHFFHGRLTELSERIESFIAETAKRDDAGRRASEG